MLRWALDCRAVAFAVGIAYVSSWYPTNQQGTAMGILGVGNIGAAVTSFVAPLLMLYMGWVGVARFYAIILAIVGIGFWFLARMIQNITDDTIHSH